MTKKLSLLGKTMALVGTFFLWTGASFGQGETCATAVAVPGSGTYTADGPATGGGAALNCFGFSATNADWYSFTPPSNGTLDISACADPGDVDSRLSVYSGGCGGLVCEDSNDDACNVSGYSSEVTGLAVTGGATYHIEWDDRWSTNGFDWDLTFTPAPLCTSPAATASVTDDCPMNQFSVDVDLTSIGDAPNVDIIENVNGGGDVVVHDDVSALMMYAMGPYTVGDIVNIRVLHNGDPVCDLDLGNFESLGCPTVVTCGPALNQGYCYPDNDLSTFAYTGSIAGPLDLTFNSGYIENCCDRLEIYDGTDNTGALLFDSFDAGFVGNDLTGVSVTAASGNIFMEFDSDGSVDCADDGNGPWDYDVQCFLCTAPTATASTTLNCGAGTYTVTVDVTALGDAPNVDITSTANGGLIPGGDDVGTGMYTTPAIPLGTPTDIEVVHNGDPTCNVNLGTFNELATSCPITSYPYCESFDTFTNSSVTACSGDATLDNGWSNPLPNADWNPDDFGTPSSATGPSDDITGGGKYLFVETSSTSGACEATAESPTFDIGALNAGNGAEVSLNYHMFGATMGDFRVEVEDVTNSPGTYTTIFGPISGDQGNVWNFTGWIDLSGVTGPEVRFRVIAFNLASYQSDIAFDEFCVREQLACVPPAATAVVIPDCGTNSFTIEVDLTSIGSATDVDIVEDVNAGGANVVHDDVSALQVYVLGPYTNGDNVDVSVLHNQDAACDISLGTLGGTLNCAPQSTCALGLALPDNNCGSGGVDFIVPATAPGTSLGTDVFLNSIDLIVSHTFNSDLEIELTSPNGVTLSLIADRFGSGDNLGDPTNCPTDVLTLVAGGAPLTTSATSNVTGNFAPESGDFTGYEDGSDPNGSWTLNICDDAGGDTGDLEYIQLNFVTCSPPSATAVVSEDCANNQFFVDVDLTDLGSATDVDIVSDLNGVEFDDVSALMVYSAGPFPSGSTANITVTHNQDGACDISLGAFSFTCPPPNDTCGGAIAVACNSVVSGSTANGATDIDAPGTCGTSLNTSPGVWYSVVGTGGTMSASLCGAPYDSKIGVFEGPCGALNCVVGEDDDFTVCGGNDPSVEWASTLGVTYYVYVTGFSTNTGTFDLAIGCQGDVGPPCTDNELSMEITTDGNGSETSFEIYAVGIPVPVCEASGFANNTTVTTSCCLLDGCYTLAVFDSFGDGISGGGYVLYDGNGDRIIDNAGNGDNFTSVSALANGNGFCLPLGTDQLQYGSCDNEALELTDFVVAEDNPAVAAEFGGPNAANSGFQYYLSDPNGTYSRYLFISHANPTQGAPPGPNAVNHLRFSNIYTLPVPTGILLNVRVRGRVAGVYSNFGPACRVRIDPAAAACPPTHLIDDPNNQFFSCGVNKVFGGSDKVYAKPIAGANRYQFRFEIPSEGFVRQIAKPSYALILSWGTLPLEAGKTYDVTVRASFDNGANYCPFDKSCTVTITGVVPATGGVAARSIESTAPIASTMTIWPNPNRGEVLNILMSDLPENEEIAQVMIIDTYGKTVQIASVPVIGGEVNAVIELSNDLATGMYIVQATAGSSQQFDRIVIEK